MDVRWTKSWSLVKFECLKLLLLPRPKSPPPQPVLNHPIRQILRFEEPILDRPNAIHTFFNGEQKKSRNSSTVDILWFFFAILSPIILVKWILVWAALRAARFSNLFKNIQDCQLLLRKNQECLKYAANIDKPGEAIDNPSQQQPFYALESLWNSAGALANQPGWKGEMLQSWVLGLLLSSRNWFWSKPKPTILDRSRWNVASFPTLLIWLGVNRQISLQMLSRWISLTPGLDMHSIGWFSK